MFGKPILCLAINDFNKKCILIHQKCTFLVRTQVSTLIIYFNFYHQLNEKYNLLKINLAL